MHVLLVNEADILGSAVLTLQNLYIVLLDCLSLIFNLVIRISDSSSKELLPFAVRKLYVVKLFQAFTQISDKVCFLMNVQIGVAVFNQQADKFLFQLRFALVAVRASWHRLIFGYNRAFRSFRYDIEIRHGLRLLF